MNDKRATAVAHLRDQAARIRRTITLKVGGVDLDTVPAKDLVAVIRLWLEADALDSVADELDNMPVEAARALTAQQERRAAAQAHRDAEEDQARARRRNPIPDGLDDAEQESAAISGRPVIVHEDQAAADAAAFAEAARLSPLAENARTSPGAEDEE